MGELLAFMDQLRLHLRESGFTGAQWQVDRRTLVATANFLHNGERWIAVDLESGVPAVTLLRYWVQGARLGRFPLFDDTDFPAVWSYLDRHADRLIRRLGPAKAGALRIVLKELEAQERLWKAGEVALLREPRRWMAPEGRDQIRRQALDRWVQEGRMSPKEAARAADATVRFLGHWLFGGLLSRTQRLVRFVQDPEYRSTAVAPRVAAWVQHGRLHPETATRLLQHPHLLPLAGLALCSLMPASLLRGLRDPLYRRWAIRRVYRVLLDERYQLSLAEEFIGRRIREWEKLHGLTAEEAKGLHRMVATPSAQEYVRGFGVHLALKALLPSAFLDPLFVGLAVGVGSVYPLALLFIRSLAITAYTIFRWSKRPDLHFGTALAIGLVPKIGLLAYPSQLVTVHPELASFLVRDVAAQMAERLPIYGGRHTLTQYYSVRCADLLLSCAHRFARLWRRVSGAIGLRR